LRPLEDITLELSFDASAYDAVTLVTLAVGLAITGIAGGVLAGLLGVGGGIVVVPVLFWLLHAFDISPDFASHLAVGTSLATIIPTSISSCGLTAGAAMSIMVC
jgi:uncharacterized membrane protein YfcA